MLVALSPCARTRTRFSVATGLVHELITTDAVEENRSQLPDDPRPDDLMHLVGEIERRVADLNIRNGKQLVYRAMLLRALQDWRDFGTLVFADRWLV